MSALDIAIAQYCAALSLEDRLGARIHASSGNLYTHALHGQSSLLGDELRSVAALCPGEPKRADTVISSGNGWRHPGHGRSERTGRLQIYHQLPDAFHLAAIVDDKMHRHVDGKLHKALVQRHFGHQVGLGGFIHDFLRGLIARLKALFRGSVE